MEQGTASAPQFCEMDAASVTAVTKRGTEYSRRYREKHGALINARARAAYVTSGGRERRLKKSTCPHCELEVVHDYLAEHIARKHAGAPPKVACPVCARRVDVSYLKGHIARRHPPPATPEP